MGEDESHSGDSSADLFIEEELLPLSDPSLKTVTRPGPVLAKPRTPTEESSTTQSVLKPHMEELDSSLPVKINMHNSSRLALAKPIQPTTEDFTKLRALQSSTTTDNFRAIWHTKDATPQTLPGIEEEREKRTISQMMLNMESTSSYLKSASSEIRGNIEPNTVAAIISQSEVSMKTLTEQTHNAKTISKGNFSQTNEPFTLLSLTPSPSTQSQTTIIPETYSITIIDEEGHMKTNAGTTATTTDSGNTGTNSILTILHVNEGEDDSSTTASMTTDRQYSTTTTVTTGKPNEHSISLDEELQSPKRQIFRTVADEAVEEKPQRQPGKHTRSLRF